VAASPELWIIGIPPFFRAIRTKRSTTAWDQRSDSFTGSSI